MELNSSHIIIFDQNKRVLLLKRSVKDEWEPRANGALQDGRRKENETLIQNIQRETKEETGLTIFPEKILFLPEISKKLNHVLFATNEFSGKIKLDHENSTYKWSKIEEIDEKMSVPNLRDEILAAKKYLEQPKIILRIKSQKIDH